MKNKKKKEIISFHLLFLLIFLVYYVITTYGGIGCPIRWITNFPCPTCGITRAWKATLKLDFAKAFEMHPMYIFITIFAWTVMHSKLKIFNRFGKRFRILYTIIGVLLILGTYIYRIIYGFGSM